MNENTKAITQQEWIALAMEVLEAGVDLMTDDQIREWAGVRLALELGAEFVEREAQP